MGIVTAGTQLLLCLLACMSPATQSKAGDQHDYGKVDISRAEATAREVMTKAMRGDGTGIPPAWIATSKPKVEVEPRRNAVDLTFIEGAAATFDRTDGSLRNFYISHPTESPDAPVLGAAECREVVIRFARSLGYRDDFVSESRPSSTGQRVGHYVTLRPTIQGVAFMREYIFCEVDERSGRIVFFIGYRLPNPPPSLTPAISRADATEEMQRALQKFKALPNVAMTYLQVGIEVPGPSQLPNTMTPRLLALSEKRQTILAYVGRFVDKNSWNGRRYVGIYDVKMDARTGEIYMIIPWLYYTL
jgi:hypothetical protein